MKCANISCDEPLMTTSLNCRGLASKEKRKDLFSLFKSKRYDIIYLQDIHWDETTLILAKQEWDYKLVCAPFDTHSRGTAILFNNTFEFSLGIIKNDPNGNYTLVELYLPNKLSLILGSIYAPNQDTPNFIQNIKIIIEEFENPNILLGGDWNSTRNYRLDNYNYVNQNNPKMTGAISELAKEFSLADAWRINHPQKRQFTWLQGRSNKQACLDYFLCNEEFRISI